MKLLQNKNQTIKEMNISSPKLYTVIFIALLKLSVYFMNKNAIQQCCQAFRVGVIAFEANAAILHRPLKAGKLFWAHFSP